MALFPAFGNQFKPQDKVADNSQSWLENPSFSEDLCIQCDTTKNNIDHPSEIQNDPHTSANDNSDRSSPKIKKKKLHTSIMHKEPHYLKSDYFTLELKGAREFLSVNTISWPAAPKYRPNYDLDIKHKKIKQKKFKRYFQTPIDILTTDKNIVGTLKSDLIKQADEHFTGFVQEQELSQKTASYNQHLALYPCDVKMWLEYVKFQDVVHQFEKTYRKGSIAKAQRVLAERKLSILEKALSNNVNCELLQRERLNVAVHAFPADELQIYLKLLVDKNTGNIILWQGYIEAIQCSMSHCTTPAVLEFYTKCLSKLHQLRRATALEKHLLEESILKMLYQCGLFLKQAGLFEQLWTLLKMYLELNLSPNNKNKFDILSGFNDNQLIELEEVIFTSQLPLHELWLRTEKLRESCHWLPYLGNEVCEDPQRIIFPEDVVELIHPITTPENIFKLTATIFSLLKIPLLPCRHTTMQDIGLDYVSWSLDSIEPLLPLFLSLYPVDVIDETFFKDQKLAVGPQYLKAMPGQEEYLKFILTVMKNCSECLIGDDQLAVTIWWFRFQRLLIILEKKKQIKLSDQIKKQIKKNSKDLLKLPENRQNILYYLEYGLLEKELGNREACLNIINVALKMDANICFQSNEWNIAHATWCFLHRQYVELLMDDCSTTIDKSKVMLILSEFVLQRKLDDLSKKDIEEADKEFRTVTKRIINQGISNLQPSNHFLPDFLLEWIICNAWFIYLNEGIQSCSYFMNNTLDTLEESNKNPCLQKEVLYEFYTALLFKHWTSETTGIIFKLLETILYKAIEIYPNNLFLLSVLVRKHNFLLSFGPVWWKVQNMLLKSGRALCTLFAVIILNQHILKTQEMLTDSITGKST